ncbi:MAG: hypothetical protein GF418_08830, partial [Chitinivibrionales bacterium]|nr:hypothetical protein [Chitinivibrionales bacterium]MBD3395717.1 hypothetical protein [Chitinivibrionales bacterium]
MRVGWIYPRDNRCGIALYGRRYTEALAKLIDVFSLDASEAVSPGSRESVRKCDLVHVQYEPAHFVRGGRDLYRALRARIPRPLIVTLHEVYHEFPGVFPRSAIRGRGPVRWLRERLYDLRHPVHTRYRKHVHARFGAQRIVVHYPYQKGIVVDQGIPSGMVEIIPHPTVTPPARNPVPRERPDRRPLHFGCTGFINANYDYELLFNTLQAIEKPWRFTWIGGIRREEDRVLLERIEQVVRARQWEDKFSVTGWVPDGEQMDRLADIDVYLALFVNRSTSGSLLMA